MCDTDQVQKYILIYENRKSKSKLKYIWEWTKFVAHISIQKEILKDVLYAGKKNNPDQTELQSCLVESQTSLKLIFGPFKAQQKTTTCGLQNVLFHASTFEYAILRIWNAFSYPSICQIHTQVSQKLGALLL